MLDINALADDMKMSFFHLPQDFQVVRLSFGGQFADLDEAIGDTPHGRIHDGQRVARLEILLDDRHHLIDALQGTDRRTSKFYYFHDEWITRSG